MPADELPRNADGKDASSKLSQGLKSCRDMVANYREMLGAGATAAAADPDLDAPEAEGSEKA